jgi:hypothetical protein
VSLVTFQFEDGTEYDLRDPEPGAVAGELERIGSRIAMVLAGEVKRAGSDERAPIIKLGVAVDRFLALLRALDHIKNGAGKSAAGRPDAGSDQAAPRPAPFPVHAPWPAACQLRAHDLDERLGYVRELLRAV